MKKTMSEQKISEMGNEVLTEKELAVALGQSVWTIRRWRKQEGLPVIRFKNIRSILYYRPAVDDWLRTNSFPSVPAENHAIQNDGVMTPIPD